jgi:large subunit ribosomal protein L24
MKVKKGDNVLILAGKDKGRTGKITRSFPKELKILVEGMNLKKKHIRPKKEGEKGQVIGVPAPINASNVKIICPKCGKASRVGYKIIKKMDEKAKGKRINKKRICKKCEQEI